MSEPRPEVPPLCEGPDAYCARCRSLPTIAGFLAVSQRELRDDVPHLMYVRCSCGFLIIATTSINRGDFVVTR